MTHHKLMPIRVRGFTLVELAIVVVIAGILAAVAIPIYQGIVDESKWTEARTGVGAIRHAVDVYKVRNGNTLPTVTVGQVSVHVTTLGIEPTALTSLKFFNEADFQFSAVDTANGTYTIRVQGSKPESPSGTLLVNHQGTETGP